MLTREQIQQAEAQSLANLESEAAVENAAGDFERRQAEEQDAIEAARADNRY